MGGTARLWAATALLYCAVGWAYPLLPLYMAYRGLTASEIGLVFSTATLASLAPLVALGRLSDILPREVVTSLLELAFGLLMLAYSTVASLPGFIAVHSAYALLSYSSMTLASAAALDYLGGEVGRGFGRFRTSGAVGWVLGTLSGGAIARALGVRGAIQVSAPIFWASAVLFALGRRAGVARQRVISERLALSARIYGLLAAVFVTAVTNPAYYSFLPLYITKILGGDSLTASLAFSITPLAEVPAMMYLGSLSDRVGRLKVIALCLAAYPLRYLLTSLARSPVKAILAQLLHGLTFGGLYVVSTAYIADEVGSRGAGLALSLYTASTTAGGLVGGYLLGCVVEREGYRAMYVVAAAISLLSYLPLLVSHRAGRNPH